MDQTVLSTITAAAMGVGLSAACGFRIFVPILFLSAATRLGYVHPAAGWQWVGSTPAIVTLSTATVVEILAYYIPWLDHALDMIAAPAALAAGTLMTASLVTDASPLVRWSLAIIAGGGAAGVVQALTMTVRAASTATTGGIGNPVVSTLEAAGAFILSAVAIIAPFAALVMALLAILLVARFATRLARRRKAALQNL